MISVCPKLSKCDWWLWLMPDFKCGWTQGVKMYWLYLNNSKNVVQRVLKVFCLIFALECMSKRFASWIMFTALLTWRRVWDILENKNRFIRCFQCKVMLCVTGFCKGNPPMTGNFRSQGRKMFPFDDVIMERRMVSMYRTGPMSGHLSVLHWLSFVRVHGTTVKLGKMVVTRMKLGWKSAETWPYGMIRPHAPAVL